MVIMDAAKKILIVDDEISVVKGIEILLKDNKYEAAVAYDGEEALKKIKLEKPDLIILDLTLPKIDGYEICRTLESDAEYKKIPVIMLTAREDVKDMETGMKIGASAYLTKPFNMEMLLGIVKGLLGEPPQ